MIASNFDRQLVTLRQQLIEYFDDEELRTLCFDLGIVYDSLPAQGKEGKAREFMLQLLRTGRMPEFIANCRQLRPNVPWEFTVGTTPSDPTSVLDEMFSEATRYHVTGDLGYALQLYRHLQQIAPDYPRIDATIAAVEREMGARYVDRYGRVREDLVVHPAPSAPLPAPSAPSGCAGSSLGIWISVIIVVIMLMLVLIYLWMRSMGG